MNPRSPDSLGFLDVYKKTIGKKGRVALGALALSVSEPACSAPISSSAERVTKILAEPQSAVGVPEVAVDPTNHVETPAPTTKTDIFVYHANGEYTHEERQARITKLKNGAELLNDAGVYFYHVRKGDTPSEITEALARDPKFAYLKSRGYGIDSYNANAKLLQPGMWLPVPAERGAYTVTDKEFLSAAGRAIDRMKKDPTYGKEMTTLLKLVSRDNLRAGMLAVAKLESGGHQIGELSLALWQADHRVFSLSAYHVLMEGDGLDARKNLGMTEGQLFNHENASALFLAFLCEKGDPSKLFPLDKHLQEFATLYNGASWKKTNANYARDLGASYRKAVLALHEE